MRQHLCSRGRESLHGLKRLRALCEDFVERDRRRVGREHFLLEQGDEGTVRRAHVDQSRLQLAGFRRVGLIGRDQVFELSGFLFTSATRASSSPFVRSGIWPPFTAEAARPRRSAVAASASGSRSSTSSISTS